MDPNIRCLNAGTTAEEVAECNCIPDMKWRIRVVIDCSDSFAQGGESGRHRFPREAWRL